VFEDNPSGGSSSLEEMRRLEELDPRNKEVIFLYMGGDELNSSPTQSANRFIIDFGERTEEEARQWPLLFKIVEERVKPVRAVNKQRNYRDNWWLHVTRVPEAADYLRKNGRVLAFAQLSKHLGVVFVQPGTVLSNTIVLVLLCEYAGFALVQSQVHEAWGRFTGSSLEDRLRYTTDCFDTFPRPIELTGALESIGKRYYDFRADLMIRHNEGLTKTYNHFHDRQDQRPDIVKLRELHAEMDRAVLDAYGWTDLRPTYDFRVQLDESTRYTWDDATRDEVLGRLLDLNRRYAAEEAAAKELAAKKTDEPSPKKDANASSAATPPTSPPARKKRGPKKGGPGQTNLFD
jgi:hypothetical protein